MKIRWYTRMYPHYIDERKGNQKTLTRSSCKKTLGLATARPRNSAFPTWGLTMFLASNIPIFLASYQLPSSVLSEDISQSSSSAPQDWFEITLSWSHTSITVMGGDILISSLTMEGNIVNMEPKTNLLKGDENSVYIWITLCTLEKNNIMKIDKMVEVYVWHLVPYTSTEGMRRSWSHVGDKVSSITLPIILIVICYYHISFIHIACIHFEADFT